MEIPDIDKPLAEKLNKAKIVIIDKNLFINSLDDALNIIGNVRYQSDCDKVIIRKTQLTPSFFDLKTRLAGEILQKFSTYGMRIAIVGDFSQVSSKSLHNFILESNNGKQVAFVGSIEEAIKKLG